MLHNGSTSFLFIQKAKIVLKSSYFYNFISNYRLMKKLYFLFLLSSIMLVSSFSVAPINDCPDYQQRTVQFYPNPASSVIYFEFPSNFEKANYSLHVYNFLGRKMTEIQLNNSKVSIQLDNYFRGLYVFQIRDKSGNIIESGKFQVVK